MPNHTKDGNGWLTLGRRVGEELVINVPPSSEPTQIRVQVAEVKREGSRFDPRDNVRLATLAPRAVEVLRNEVAEKGGAR